MSPSFVVQETSSTRTWNAIWARGSKSLPRIMNFSRSSEITCIAMLCLVSIWPTQTVALQFPLSTLIRWVSLSCAFFFSFSFCFFGGRRQCFSPALFGTKTWSHANSQTPSYLKSALSLTYLWSCWETFPQGSRRNLTPAFVVLWAVSVWTSCGPVGGRACLCRGIERACCDIWALSEWLADLCSHHTNSNS